MVFFDLTKGFDSIDMETLWTILLRYGCPVKFVNIVKLLNTDMKASVITGSATTNSLNTGVKQGCVLAPMLFDIFLAAFLEFVSNRLPLSVDMHYRTDGNLFNLRRLQACTKVSSSAVVKLQYADDCAVMTLSEVEL